MTDDRRPARSAPHAAESPGLRPLYRQVKDLLLRRIADQVWQPGELIPSDHQIAAELGVDAATLNP